MKVTVLLFLATVFLLAWLCGCATTIKSEAPVTVRMADLLHRPQEFNGRLVRVLGYVRIEEESLAVYESAAEVNDPYRQGIALGPAKNPPMIYPTGKGYLWITGTFAIGKAGHMALWDSAITEILTVELPGNASGKSDGGSGD